MGIAPVRWWAGRGAVAFGVAAAMVAAPASPVLAQASPRPSAPAAPAGGGTTAGGISLPRDETLYTSGTSFSAPTDFNPLQGEGPYTGTQGLLYEPLFLYDPVKGRLIDWLAAGGAWSGPSTYRLTVRPGVLWVKSPSGTTVGPLTGADVAASINAAARLPADPYHADAEDVESATAHGASVTVRFNRIVNYAAWDDYLWHAPVVPARDLGAPIAGGASPTLPVGDNRSPVSTGPMLLYATSPKEACFRDNPRWWGWSALHLQFSFRYLCDVVSGPSGQQLSDLLDNRLDWSNALLRGVPDLVGVSGKAYGLKTYYSGAPYMLAAGTSWLEMNTARPPMSDLDFRRAVAAAVDPSAIVTGAYMGTVAAAGPTGLLPNLAPYVDEAVVKRDAPHYSLSKAKKYLAESGYKSQRVAIDVPEKAPDLAAAAAALVKQLKAAGIKAWVDLLPRGERVEAMESGDYDMVIDDSAGLSATPWEYFDKVFALPVKGRQAQGLNIERLDDPAAWALVRQAASVPLSDTKQLDAIYGQLEADFLGQVAEVPVWYSGAWFQANTTYWQGYPSASSADDRYTPVMWPGWLGSTTTVLALAALRRH